MLAQEQGRTFRRNCDADVGDSRCGVNIDQPAFRGDATVVSVVDRRIVTASGLDGYDNGFFARGKVQFTDGENDGLVTSCRGHVNDGSTVTVTLWERAPLTIAAGDTFKVFAGCDKRLATCRAKFDNVTNHRGIPYMPGNDRAFSYAVVGEEGHDGSSFFN